MNCVLRIIGTNFRLHSLNIYYVYSDEFVLFPVNMLYFNVGNLTCSNHYLLNTDVIVV